MSQAFQMIVTASAVILVVAIFRQRKEIRACWNISATAVFAIGWLLNVTYPLAELTGDYTLVRDPTDGNLSIVYGTLTERFHLLSLGIIATLCAIIFLRALRRSSIINSSAVISIALLALTVASAFQHHISVDWRAAGGMLMILALAVILPAGHGAHLGAAMFGVSSLAVSAILLVVKSEASTQPCELKCGPLGVLYTGIFPNENAFGLAVALAVPFILVGLRGGLRTWAMIASGIAVVATDSRTAQFALSLTFLAFILVSALRKSHRKLADASLTTLVFALAGAGLFLPFWLGSIYSSQFTGRTALWGVGVQQWKKHWFLGWGQGGWEQIATTIPTLHGEVTYSPHNQWLAILIYGGVVAAILFTCLIASIHYSDNRRVGGIVLVAALSAGLLERPWSMSSPDWLFWSLMAACLGGSRAEREQSADGETLSHRTGTRAPGATGDLGASGSPSHVPHSARHTVVGGWRSLSSL